MDTTEVLLGFDRDRENLERARVELTPLWGDVRYIHASFEDIAEVCEREGINAIDFILYDLGVSSVHFDEADRGFSFRFDAPLDMRFDRTNGKTAADMIATLDAPALAKIIGEYGEEKRSWPIAQAMVRARELAPILTTHDLLRCIESASYDKKAPLRVFQGLRIALNDEFGHIERSLGQAIELLSIGGRIAVITFHSLEDRLVKNIFAPYLEDEINDITGQISVPARFRKFSKKPITPTPEEIESNPRSRSAKLRIIERVS